MQQAPSGGPHILGFDVIFIATMLSAVATFAVMLAIYAATTVKDPMVRRVKALNERREHLKAEGLDQVVVRAGVEPDDLIVRAVLRGEHEDAEIRTFAADASAHRETVGPGHEHVEDDRIGLPLA